MPTNGGLGWLNTRLPIWAVVGLMILTGSGTIAGGSWRWLQNNEPRFEQMQDRLEIIERNHLGMIEENRREIARLAAETARQTLEFSRVWAEVEKRVRTTERMEMLGKLDETDERLERRIERLEGSRYGGRDPADLLPP